MGDSSDEEEKETLQYKVMRLLKRLFVLVF
jgi:hypothetical protein